MGDIKVLFNSYIFILFFLPLTLGIYYGLNKIGKSNAAKLFLITASLFFYGYFRFSYILIITGSIIFNYLCSCFLLRENISDYVRKVLLLFGILLNVGLIGYFKYFNFLLENINVFFHSNIPLKNILMPLGISFFTFQQISYLVDSYRKETKEYGFMDYALYVTFFPQLVAGPIVLHDEILHQFTDKRAERLSQSMLSQGVFLFAIGLFKKVMIADTMGRGVDWAYTDVSVLTGMEATLVSLLYTFQIYFDFSGYCDMACGIAKMFHINLPMNFNSPYKSTSILEFWQRWHMTLTRFLRKYVYIPLGGNRKGIVRTMVNIFVVFLVSGIWHGAAWTFVLWGILHGLANILCRLFKNGWEKLPKVLRWLMTFTFVDLAWVLFRSKTISEAKCMYQKIFSNWQGGLSTSFLNNFRIIEFTYIEDHVDVVKSLVVKFPAFYVCFVLVLGFLLVLIPKNSQEVKFVPNIRNGIGCVILLVWTILSLSGITTFLYFNF